MVAFAYDDGIFGAQFVKVGKCGTEHGVGRYITESALVIKLFQSGLYRGNIADDAILGESGQYLVKSIQRIFHGCRIDNQFGLEFFNLLECGISVGVVNETKAFRVYIKYSGFVLEAQYIGKEGAHFTGS